MYKIGEESTVGFGDLGTGATNNVDRGTLGLGGARKAMLPESNKRLLSLFWTWVG
jgi:hypothetical protein